MSQLKTYMIIIGLVLTGIYLFGQEDSIAYSITVDSDMVITGQNRPTHYGNVIYDVDIIDQELITDIGATQLEQALQLLPQIRLSEDLVLGTQVTMNGLNARNVAILIDGIPVIGRQGGAVNVSQIPTQNIERIEVVNGPLSNIYGNNAAAGVINIITKQGQSKPWALSLDYQTETIGRHNYEANISHQHKKWRLAAHGRYFKYDQYDVDSLRVQEAEQLENGSTATRTKYPWNPKEQYGAGASGSYFIDGNNKIVLKYDYNFEEVNDYGQIRRPVFRPYANDNIYETQRQDVALLYNGLINHDYYIDFSLGYNKYDRLLESNRLYIETQEFDPDLFTTSSTYFDTWFSRINISRSLSDNWEIIAGATFNNQTGGGDRIEDISQEDSTSAEFTEVGYFAEVKYMLNEKLQLSTSGRLISHSNYNTAFTPAFHLKYDFASDWNIRASYAKGYRNPDLRELYFRFIDVNHFILGNPDLKPEFTDDLRATITYDANFGLKAELIGYRTEVKDQIGLFAFNDDSQFTYGNISKYDVYGGMINLQYQIAGFKLSSGLHQGYWATNIEHDDAPEHREVFDMNHTLTYDFSTLGIGLLANYRYIGKLPSYQLNSDNIVTINTIEPVSYLDFSLSKRLWDNRIKAVAGVKNILDTQRANISGSQASGGAHSSSASSRNVSQGRSWFINLSLTL